MRATSFDVMRNEHVNFLSNVTPNAVKSWPNHNWDTRITLHIVREPCAASELKQPGTISAETVSICMATMNCAMLYESRLRASVIFACYDRHNDHPSSMTD